MIDNSLNYTLPSISFNDLLSRDEALMSYVCPSHKVYPTHEDTLEEDNDILDSLPSINKTLVNKELIQVNIIHVLGNENPKVVIHLRQHTPQP